MKLCPTITSGSTVCTLAKKKLSSARSLGCTVLGATASRRFASSTRCCRSSGHAWLSSLRTPVKEKKRPSGRSVWPSMLTSGWHRAEIMTISLHRSRSLSTVCRCTLMTHSAGLSGAPSVILATFLGFPTRTSVLHQLRADATGSTPCRGAQLSQAPRLQGSAGHRGRSQVAGGAGGSGGGADLDLKPARAHQVALEQEQLHARLRGAKDPPEGPAGRVRRQRRELGRVDHLEVLCLDRHVRVLPGPAAGRSRALRPQLSNQYYSGVRASCGRV